MRKQMLSILLSLCMILLFIPTGIFADGESNKNISLGLSALKNNQDSFLYFGNYKQFSDGTGFLYPEPIKWRVLSNENNTAWLLSDKILDVYYYHNENSINVSVYWKDTLMKKWLNSEDSTGGFSDKAFSSKELDTILLKSADLGKVMLLSDKEVKNSSWSSNKRTILPSVDTAFARGGGTINQTKGADCYILRSDNPDDYLDIIKNDGSYDFSIFDAGMAFGVRPSMYLDNPKVLFTSPASGGKTESGLTSVSDYSRNEYKLTVLDADRNNFLVTKKSQSGSTIQFDYDLAKTGNKEFISAMIVNGDTVKYYGRIKNVNVESGTLSLSIPSTVDANNGDRLFVFNEQCNGDYKTDYASPLRELSLENSSSNMPLLQINSVTNEWEISYDDGTTWTSLNVKATGETGAKGDKGDTGASGMDGANGADGKDGITPMLKVGDDNMWHVSYDNGNVWTSLGVKATGAKGDKGDTGASGKDGLIPHIGINGNWWLDNTDTGVQASVKGDQGENGITPQLKIDDGNIWSVSYDGGQTWASLNVKATGDTGASGRDGINGIDGKDGITPMLKVGDNNLWHISYDSGNTWMSLGTKATGDVGIRGEKGDTGLSGKDGSNGVDGENGVGISNANINAEGELILTYTNGASINLGRVVGEDGLTPYIGDNGNWWLGEKDTGVSSIAVLGSDLLSSPVIITIGTIAGLAFISNVGLILYIVFKKK